MLLHYLAAVHSCRPEFGPRDVATSGISAPYIVSPVGLMAPGGLIVGSSETLP